MSKLRVVITQRDEQWPDYGQPNQTETRTTLGELGNQPVESPATIVVGAVAALDLRSIVVPITTHEAVPR